MNATTFICRFGLPATLRRRAAPAPDPTSHVEGRGQLLEERRLRAVVSDSRWREIRGPGGDLQAYAAAHVPADECPTEIDRTERWELQIAGRTFGVVEVDPARQGLRRLWLDYGRGAGA